RKAGRAPRSVTTTRRSVSARSSRASRSDFSTSASARAPLSARAQLLRGSPPCSCSRCRRMLRWLILMPKILVTNDDGVHSEGIKALAAALAPLGEVTVVAPMTEASAIGHALTLRRPLRLETIGPKVYAVDGTPTDCVNIAITH